MHKPIRALRKRKNILLLVGPHISSPFVNLSWWYKSRIIPECTIMISTRNSYVFINENYHCGIIETIIHYEVNVFVINMQVLYGRSWVSNYIPHIAIIYTRPKIPKITPSHMVSYNLIFNCSDNNTKPLSEPMPIAADLGLQGLTWVKFHLMNIK